MLLHFHVLFSEIAKRTERPIKEKKSSRLGFLGMEKLSMMSVGLLQHLFKYFDLLPVHFAVGSCILIQEHE